MKLGQGGPFIGGLRRTISRFSAMRGYYSPEVKHPRMEQEFKGMQPHFPCLDRLKGSGPVSALQGAYGETISGYKLFNSSHPFHFKHGGVLPQIQLAYEDWGELNAEKSNAIILHTGLSASSHAKSHNDNPSPGWWEKFIGPGKALDTNKFYVVCANVIGGCYGSSGPSHLNPSTGKEYAMTFPLVSVEDMVCAQFLLMDRLGIGTVHAVVGSSLGGMQSLMSAAIHPTRVGRVVSVSACARMHPTSIAFRYVQRRILMSDPNWRDGRYYGISYPRMGMHLAREVGTITYRSGPEWHQRFGNSRQNPSTSPDFCPDFQIESYLEKQGEKFCTSYDPNSFLYISKAMDMFDMSEGFDSLTEGVSRIQCPVLVLGVVSDILFPIRMQRELAEELKKSGNEKTTYYELSSIYGHDTFMLDVNNVGAAVKGHLESTIIQ